MRTDSPEDRLLHLIKGKYKKKIEGEAPSSSKAKDTLLTEASKKIFMKNKALRPLFSDSINRILVIVMISLAGYLGYSLLFPAYRNIGYFSERSKTLESPREASSDIFEEDRAPVSPERESYSAYSRAIQGKKLFSAPFLEEDASGKAEPEIDVSRRFNLVGIIAGEDPQAIIEDKEGKKTHYLYKGQAINGVTVAEIKESGVVLEYRGKEVMLVL